MHVLFDHQIFTWQWYGGISRYYRELIARLCHIQGVDVSLFLGWHVNEYGLDTVQHNFKNYWGKKHAHQFGNVPFKLINGMMLKMISGRIKPDVYHQTYYDYIDIRTKAKRVVTVHDMIHELYPHFFPFYDMTSRRKRESIQKADGIICVSEATKGDLLNCYPSLETRVKVVYHGIDLSRQHVVDSHLIDSSYVLYVGQRSRYKNFSLLFNAYAKCRRVNAHYKLVCFGGGAFSSAEEKDIAKFGLSSKVEHLDGDDAMLTSLYKNASVIVVPSLYEGFGFPPLEAMSYGCPVLVSNTSSLPEVVGDAGIYFDPHKEDDLIDKLETLLFDETLRQKLIQAGYGQVNKFNWETCASETLQLYRDL